MTTANPFVQLLPDLTKKPQMVPAEQVKHLEKLDPEALALFKRAGLTAEMLQKSIEEDVKVSYDRFNIYEEVRRATEHWFVGPAMNLYGNQATSYNPIHNATAWVTSQSETYAKELNAFLNNIGTEEKIFDWGFSIATYGDMFVRLNGVPGLGVISIEDGMHPMNLSRVEYDGILVGFYKTPQGNAQLAGQTDYTGEKALIPPWDFVHFRLLGAKQKRPRYPGDPSQTEMRQIHLITGTDTTQVTTRYGTSLIMDALPAYKRLRLAEDSVLLARLTRGIIKYIWKLKIDSCLHGDTKIQLMNGTCPSIREMAGNESSYIGKGILTVNEKTKNLEVGKIKAVKKTRKDAQLVKVTLDNGESIKCTPDHPFMMRDGTYREAQYLQPEDSLMPYYSKLSEKGISGYNLVYDPGRGDYRYEHRLAVGKLKEGQIPHHLDCHKLNNDPSNFMIFESQSEHVKWHHEHSTKFGFAVTAKESKSKEHIEKVVNSRKSNGKPWHSEQTKENIRNAHKGEREIRNCLTCGTEFECLITKDRKYCSLKCAYAPGSGRTKNRRKLRVFISKPCECGTCEDYFKEQIFPQIRYPRQRFIKKHDSRGTNNPNSKTSRRKREELKNLNHKVLMVEWLAKREDTYDIEVEGNHNFPLATGIFVHNSTGEAASALIDQYASLITHARAIDTSAGSPTFDSKNNQFSVLEDLFVPVWGSVEDLKVEKVGGEVDIRWIVDVDNLRNQLAFALACSPSLGGAYTKEASGALGSEALSELGIRFARSCRRLQRALISGITRMCQIHLAYMGYDPDPSLFQVHMAETSSAEEAQLMKSLDSGMKSLSTFIKTLKMVAGKRIDTLKVWDYWSDKILKMDDFHISNFFKSDKVLQQEMEMQQQLAAAKAEKEIPEETPGGKKPIGLFPESIVLDGDLDYLLLETMPISSEAIKESIERFKTKLKRANPIFDLDIRSYVPVLSEKLENIRKEFKEETEFTEFENKMQVKGVRLMEARLPKEHQGSLLWSKQRDARIWEQKFGKAKLLFENELEELKKKEEEILVEDSEL